MSGISCRICDADLSVIVDCGEQPISNRFLVDPNQSEERFSIKVASCVACGLTQLVCPPPPHALIPPYEWITYVEPEQHLDAVADMISGLESITRDSRIIGISYKEDSTLERLKKRGHRNLYRADMHVDLGIESLNAGIESIEQAITRNDLHLSKKFEQPCVIIARHILEHAQDIRRFLEGIRSMCVDGTYVIFEVPDCSKVFSRSEYSFVWEEHVTYFTEETLRQSLTLAGYEVLSVNRYSFPIEDSLVAICRPQKNVNRSRIALINSGFRLSLQQVAERYRKALTPYKGRSVIFGAGHLAVKFINLLALADLFEAVIDDNPNKKGRYMPGSKLPIIGTDCLTDDRYSICILTVSPESEKKILANNQTYVVRGKMYSAFQSSAIALPLD